MRVALHWSLCRDDALDAYQRALEIYVRRLDSLDPATEIAWLKVVVKHEALAIRRQRSDSVPVDSADLDMQPAETQRPLDELLVGRERVSRSAEALRRLKRDEAKALLLKAQGLSYQEIGERLSWSYTKVNRCITEGRARFLKVYAEIEAGDECERFAPTLVALAGGTATADALLDLRPHIRNCPACRATVRDLHATRLGRLAALWPIPALVAPLRWLSAHSSTPDPPADYYPDADAVLRQLTLPDDPPSRLLELKAQAYEWWHRLLGSDVATSAQLAAGAGGGGRIATLGAIVGLCLSGIGAGTVCVLSVVPQSRSTNQEAPPPKQSELRKPEAAEARRRAQPAAAQPSPSSSNPPIQRSKAPSTAATPPASSGRSPRREKSKAVADEFDFEARQSKTSGGGPAAQDQPSRASPASTSSAPINTAGESRPSFESAIQSDPNPSNSTQNHDSAAAEFGGG